MRCFLEGGGCGVTDCKEQINSSSSACCDCSSSLPFLDRACLEEDRLLSRILSFSLLLKRKNSSHSAGAIGGEAASISSGVVVVGVVERDRCEKEAASSASGEALRGDEFVVERGDASSCEIEAASSALRGDEFVVDRG